MKKLAAIFFVAAFVCQAVLVPLLQTPAPAVEAAQSPVRSAFIAPQQWTLAQMAVGQVAQRTDFVPRSDVMVVRPGGSIPYTKSAATAADRGSALIAARTAAASGDLIVVGPGSYTITSGQLLKNGVDWHFCNGAVVTLSKDTYGGLLDDTALYGANAAVTCTVSGYGEFIRLSSDNNLSAEAACVVLLDNASSNVSITCKSLLDNGAGNQANGVVRHAGGTLSIACETIVSTNANGLWWSDGEMYVTCDTIATERSCFYSSANDTNGGTATGHLSDVWVSGSAWIHCNRMTVDGSSGTYAAAVYTISDIITPRVWVKADQIENQGDGATISCSGNFVYVEAMKIFQTYTGTSLFGCPAIRCENDGELWLTAQKVIGGKVSAMTPGGTGIDFKSGSAWIDVLNLEDNGSATDPLIRARTTDNGNASELNLRCQTIRKAANGVGIKNDETTTTINVLSGFIRTQSGQLDIHRTAGTINVSSSVYFDPAKTTGIFQILGSVRAPNMTTAQRDAMDNPQPGTVIYNTTTGKLNVRTNSSWEAITSS